MVGKKMPTLKLKYKTIQVTWEIEDRDWKPHRQ